MISFRPAVRGHSRAPQQLPEPGGHASHSWALYRALLSGSWAVREEGCKFSRAPTGSDISPIYIRWPQVCSTHMFGVSGSLVGRVIRRLTLPFKLQEGPFRCQGLVQASCGSYPWVVRKETPTFSCESLPCHRYQLIARNAGPLVFCI